MSTKLHQIKLPLPIDAKLRELAAARCLPIKSVVIMAIEREHAAWQAASGAPRASTPERAAPVDAGPLPPGRFRTPEEAEAWAAANGPPVMTTLEPDENTTMQDYHRPRLADAVAVDPRTGAVVPVTQHTPQNSLALSQAPPQHIEALLAQLDFGDA